MSLIYTVQTIVTPEYEEEFNVWQETEHCPWLMTMPGYKRVLRLKDETIPYCYVNVWQIESMEAYRNPLRLARAKTPWGNWLAPYRKKTTRFYQMDSHDEMQYLVENPSLQTIVIDQFSVKCDPEWKQYLTAEYIPHLKAKKDILGVQRCHTVQTEPEPAQVIFSGFSASFQDVAAMFSDTEQKQKDFMTRKAYSVFSRRLHGERVFL
ncbi:hypothetical protein [Hominifimenecus sp. rT4P-3]|uniref:hypothetical protein n=1 Tax=Hominifimenecus sp. rT4P-3 TaxID=3242979 RepID=UPI003DA244E0